MTITITITIYIVTISGMFKSGTVLKLSVVASFSSFHLHSWLKTIGQGGCFFYYCEECHCILWFLFRLLFKLGLRLSLSLGLLPNSMVEVGFNHNVSQLGTKGQTWGWENQKKSIVGRHERIHERQNSEETNPSRNTIQWISKQCWSSQLLL